jgi:alkylation response protein AidB-like acyl-CoA dehydrogenase
VDFAFDADDVLMGETIRQVLQRELPAEKLRGLIEDGGTVDTALWSTLADAGLPGAMIAGRWGGAGLGLVQVATAIRECGAALAPVPVIETMALGYAVERSGSEALKEEILPAVAAGTLTGSAVLARQPTVVARRDAAGYVLSGEVRGVPFGAAADLLLLPVRLAGETALAVCRRHWPGISIGTADHNADPTCRLSRWIFAEVPAPAESVLQSGPDVAASLQLVVSLARTGSALLAIGGAQATLAETVSYIGQREQFGRAIATFQAVKHHAANMRIRLDMSEPAGYYAAWCLDREGDHKDASITAYLAATEAYLDIVKIGLQLHGAIGYTWEHQTHLYLRCAQRLAAVFGSPRDGYTDLGRRARAQRALIPAQSGQRSDAKRQAHA